MVSRKMQKEEGLTLLQFYVDLSDPIAFMPVVVSTSGLVYDDSLRFLIVKLAFWMENCPRNLVSFVVCALSVWLTLRSLWS